MKEVAELLNGMRESGVVEDYALFGAAAQMRDTEAVATLDADVLVAMSPPAGLAVIALSVGRAKDFARILALLESAAVIREDIGVLAARHGLIDAWSRFTRRFLDDKP